MGTELINFKIMEEHNFYTDIKESIEKHFSFLKEFGFPRFEERQLAYELHFETKNKDVLIDISFEATSSTAISARINQYYIDNLELENPKLKDYTNQLTENYDSLFEQYLKTNKRKFLYKIAEQYAVNGKEINDKYIEELSEIVKRHRYVLSGDFEVLKLNTEILTKRYELKIAAERIKNGTYTLLYQFLSEDDYDAFEEFTAPKDIKRYLSERAEIKKYRILDCYMNEIHLEL